MDGFTPEHRTLYAAWDCGHGEVDGGLIIGWQHHTGDPESVLVPWVACTRWSDDESTFIDPSPRAGEMVIAATLDDAAAGVRTNQRQRRPA